MGMTRDGYQDYHEVDYNEPWTWPIARERSEPVTTDHNLIALRAEQREPVEPLAAWLVPETGPVWQASWDFRPRRTSNSGHNSHDLLWYGQVDTGHQTHAMWGFRTWREWRDHLAPQDRARARWVREEMMADLALARSRAGLETQHWVVKNGSQTRAGFWAITAGWPDTDRWFWISNAGRELVVARRRSQTNRIQLTHRD